MSGPPPKAVRRRRNVPASGEWKPTVGTGWQHGPTIPVPPDGLRPESLVTWQTWFGSWFATHWTPDDLPGLRLVILTHDQVMRGEFTRGAELRMLMDNYGITPKGQQERHWTAPKVDEPAKPTPDAAGPYAGLRVVKTA